MKEMSADLLPDPEMDELSFISQWELSSPDNEFASQSIWECLQETLSSESYTCSSSGLVESPTSPASIEGPEKPAAEATAKNCNNNNNTSCATTPCILSFGNPSPPGGGQAQSYESADGGLQPMEAVTTDQFMAGPGNGLKRARSRPLALNQEHVIAERRRREKITEKLIALSAIIPGLKKRDKASILTDAIEYMKQMEQKVKALEDEAASAKETLESTAAVKKSKLSIATNDSDGLESDGILPEIEARLSKKIALIRIHCQDRKGRLVKALTEIENLHLSVINTSSVPFSDHFLDITVTAQVDEGFSMTVKDLLNKLKSALKEFA